MKPSNGRKFLLNHAAHAEIVRPFPQPDGSHDPKLFLPLPELEEIFVHILKTGVELIENRPLGAGLFLERDQASQLSHQVHPVEKNPGAAPGEGQDNEQAEAKRPLCDPEAARATLLIWNNETGIVLPRKFLVPVRLALD